MSCQADTPREKWHFHGAKDLNGNRNKKRKGRETVLPDADTSFSYLERARGSESETAARIITFKEPHLQRDTAERVPEKNC